MNPLPSIYCLFAERCPSEQPKSRKKETAGGDSCDNAPFPSPPQPLEALTVKKFVRECASHFSKRDILWQ